MYLMGTPFFFTDELSQMFMGVMHVARKRARKRSGLRTPAEVNKIARKVQSQTRKFAKATGLKVR